MGLNGKSKVFKQEIGIKGEDLACRYLEERGFKVVCRNYRKKWGEIDVVAKKKDIIHFVEVKTVSRNLSGVSRENVSRVTGEYRAEENVHPWKIKRLHRAIESYIMEKNIEGEWRLDVLAIELDLVSKKAKVRFIENIVL